MSKDYVSIIDVKDHVGEEVTIGAWVANKSGKGKIATSDKDRSFFANMIFNTLAKKLLSLSLVS